MWFLLLPVNVVSTKLISSHKISANAIATNLVSTNGVSIIMVSANTIFNLIFNLYDLEVDWIGHRELKFLRELQISPWPIAPSNFSPLWIGQQLPPSYISKWVYHMPQMFTASLVFCIRAGKIALLNTSWGWIMRWG